MIRVAVVLVPGVSWLACALLTEPWRLANEISPERAVDWTFRSWRGDAVQASNGMQIEVDGPCRDIVDEPDAILVLASERWPHEPDLVTWIHSMGQTEALVGGVDAGATLLADADVLTGHYAAMHHENIPAFQDTYLGIELSFGRYQIDDYRATCAGSSATLDFSLALLTRWTDSSLASQTADRLIYTPQVEPTVPEEADEDHEPPGPDQVAVDDRLRFALQVIADSGAEPGVIARAADAAGLSDRHLYRLCVAELAMTPREFAANVRMRRARTLLAETTMSVTSVALACGYRGTSDFCRAVRRHFGQSPTELRQSADR